jgi:signal transduction histidine kinase/FixJ family two-component response regulator
MKTAVRQPRPQNDFPSSGPAHADMDAGDRQGTAARPARAQSLVVKDVLKAIDQGFALFDERDCLVVANAVYKEIFAGIADIIRPGVAFEMLVRTAAQRGQNTEAILDPEEWVQGRLATHRAAAGVYEHKFSDGRWIQVRERKTALGQTIGTYTNVTSLVQRSEDLALARDRLDSLSRRMKGMVETSSDWIWTSDVDGHVICEPQGPGVDDGFHPAPYIAAAFKEMMKAASNTGSPHANTQPATAVRRIIHPVKLADGRALFLKISGKAVYTQDGSLEGHIGTASDETYRINIQRRMAQHTAVLESVLESIPSGVVVFSPERRVVMANRQAETLLGMATRTGDHLQPLQVFLGCELVDKIVSWSEAERGPELEAQEIQTSNGNLVVVRANFLSTGGFVVAFEDVTEQRQAIVINYQAQKLMALGELTGGVAHEFNNLLTSISGFAHMARQHVHQAEPADRSGKGSMVADCLDEVITASKRAADLTRQMLTFSRKDLFEAKTVVAADIVRPLAKMMTPLLPEMVKMHLAIDDDTSCVKVDLSQMSQAVMNLVLNARDAMPQGGAVTLRVYRGIRPDSPRSGRWLVLSVTDEGTGISEATLPRIFDPFFTTKGPGKGTGLGLSVVHGIVQRSGGTITVDSLVGRGTTFLIYLPITNAEADELAQASSLAPSGSGQYIVVVEDEPGVLRMVVQTLRAHGYRVWGAADHAELMSMFNNGLHDDMLRGGDAPAMLLTDVVLPGKSGPEIAAEMRGRFPGIQVLFMSGYVAPGIEAMGMIGDQSNVLSKPFSPDVLCRAVSQMLALGGRKALAKNAQRPVILT